MLQPQTAVGRKLNAFAPLADNEIAFLASLQRRRRRIRAGAPLADADWKQRQACILERGWAYSYKILPGGERQIFQFYIPGDFIGFSSVLLRRCEHAFAAVTDIDICEIDSASLTGMMLSGRPLSAAILWAAARDEAVLEEHLVDLGRRNALVRTAHLLLELGARLQLVGLANENGYQCPLSQSLLADALGLSPIHVNRVLRRLREVGCLTFRKGAVVYLDLPRLVAIAEYDGSYLDQDPAPLAVARAAGVRTR